MKTDTLSTPRRDAMPESVTIPLSSFEYIGVFEDPIISLWLDRGTIVEAMFKTLKAWNIDVDNVEPRTTGKPSEQGIMFKLPEKKVAFFFGSSQCKFTRDDADWSSAEESIEILGAALKTLTEISGAKLKTQNTAIAMHLQLRKVPFIELLQAFVPAQLAILESEKVSTMASIVKWNNRKITIDGSAALANGIFVKLEREFPPASSFQEIARILRSDEDAVFNALGVVEDLE
jgi:hypothetical protein